MASIGIAGGPSQGKGQAVATGSLSRSPLGMKTVVHSRSPSEPFILNATNHGALAVQASTGVWFMVNATPRQPYRYEVLTQISHDVLEIADSLAWTRASNAQPPAVCILPNDEVVVAYSDGANSIRSRHFSYTSSGTWVFVADKLIASVPESSWGSQPSLCYHAATGSTHCIFWASGGSGSFLYHSWTFGNAWTPAVVRGQNASEGHWITATPSGIRIHWKTTEGWAWPVTSLYWMNGSWNGSDWIFGSPLQWKQDHGLAYWDWGLRGVQVIGDSTGRTHVWAGHQNGNLFYISISPVDAVDRNIYTAFPPTPGPGSFVEQRFLGGGWNASGTAGVAYMEGRDYDGPDGAFSAHTIIKYSVDWTNWSGAREKIVPWYAGDRGSPIMSNVVGLARRDGEAKVFVGPSSDWELWTFGAMPIPNPTASVVGRATTAAALSTEPGPKGNAIGTAHALASLLVTVRQTPGNQPIIFV